MQDAKNFSRKGAKTQREFRKEYLTTTSGERKFTYGGGNEIVPGKSGKIDFILMGLYGAVRVR